jgi:hypothetical protein
MAQQVIELAGGIVRNLPDNRVADGTMQEIINLRPKDGAWRPVGPKEAVAQADLTDILCIHTIDDETKIYIGKELDDMIWYLTYVVYVNGVANAVAAQLIVVEETDELLFSALHRSLLISNITQEKMAVLVYDPTTLTYKVFEDGWPEIPSMDYTATSPVGGIPFASPVDLTVSGAADALAQVLVQIADSNPHTITGPVAFRFAWELVDGTLVKHTAPLSVVASTIDESAPGTITWTGAYPTFSSTFSQGEYEAIVKPYSGIIKSLNVYATRQQTPIEGTIDDCPIFADLDLKDEQFYLIASVPVDDMFVLNLTLIGFLGSLNFVGLETRPAMTTDNFSHHAIFAKSMFPYNNRIFLGNVGVTLYEGPNPTECIESDTGGGYDEYDVYFQVDVHTQSGIMTVESSFRTFRLSTVGGVVTFNLKRYYSYPDARAKTLRIYLRLGSTYYLVSSLSLTANEMLNFAFYNGTGIDNDGYLLYGIYEFSDTLTAYEVAARTALNTTYYDQNRVQLTELDNPFVFPAINSYRIGNGKVLGMSSNSVALSQGQFGQFPVYCFTTDGIWTMNIGNGDPLITNIVPLSREVCNNARSITMIDGGTVFATDKGLLIITGVVPFEISTLAEGQYLSRLTGTVNYEAIANNPNLYQVRNFLCSTDILTYISGANIAWDYINKEIIVCNPSYNYSWVYSVPHKVWFKISEVWIRFVPDFPRVYGYREVTVDQTTTPYLCEVSEEDFTGLITIHLETRPMKLSPRAYKKLNRMVVGGIVNDSLDHPFSVNLFGSADRIIWYLLNASKTFSEKSRLIIGRSTHSCQYYILVIGGQVDEEAYFTHIEVDYEERYSDKLR